MARGSVGRGSVGRGSHCQLPLACDRFVFVTEIVYVDVDVDVDVDDVDTRKILRAAVYGVWAVPMYAYAT